MKTPSDDIYQLIHAMSAAEKRYFKIHFSSEKNLGTDLFNYLNTVKEYDEKEVKNHFKNSKLSKNLKVYKIMLMELLLQSLSSFRYKKTISSTIRQNLEEVEILIDKNLLSPAFKKLLKTKKLCLEHEEYTHLVSILDWEYQFETFFNINNSSKGLELLEEVINNSKITTEIFEAKKSTHELSLAATSLYNSPPQAMSLKNHETMHLNTLLKIKENNFSKDFKKLFYAHSALGHLYHSTKKHDKEYFHKKSLLEFFIANKKYIKSNPKKYWSSIFNFANCCLRSGRKEEFEASIADLKSLEKNHPIFQNKLESILSMELAFHRKNKNFDYIIEELEPLILKNMDHLDHGKRKASFFSYISLMLTHFSLGNYSKVQFYLKRLLKTKPIRKEFKFFYEIIDLINHYEAKKEYALQVLLDSKKRKLKREEKYGTPFFVIFIDFFTQILKDKNNIPASIKQLRIEASKHPDDYCLNIFRHFMLDDWLAALENKTALREANSTNYLVCSISLSMI